MPTLTLRPAVIAARDWLTQERAKLKEQHDGGSPGIQVCTRLSDMLDRVVLDLYNSALDELAADENSPLRKEVSLVAHGGYGRRDVAPFSDVDLMILHGACNSDDVAALAKRLLHDLFDAGLILGQSVRSISDACKMALKDATIFTSLVESRNLAGSDALFEKFRHKFQRTAKRHWRRVVGDIEHSREEEREQFGETVYLLEPNIKRSPGGLRDMQLLRWVGFARYGVADPNSLQLAGVLPKEDEAALRRALEFLLRVRNELQFHSGKAHDVLDRAEQVRIAGVFGYTGSNGILPVEQFMREYFRNTDAVRHIVSRFLEGARPWVKLAEVIAPIFSHQVEGDFRVGPTRISATKRGLVKLQGDLSQVLRLADLSNMYNKRIAHGTWEAVYRAAPKMPDLVTRESAERFLSVLSQPARLGEILRDLHELGVLERLIPAFTHARSLLQFNEYHKFTVDEHCLRAVEAATGFADDGSAVGGVYRSIKQKRTLHLALLIHDLGKGFVEDHSEVGARIAEETARRLRLPTREAETVRFLVLKHLMMAHLAFRRDTSDDQVIVRFAVEVGSPEVLRMLYVLTCADLAAVGPGVLNSWKGEVLHDLYSRTLRHLSGDSPSLVADEWCAKAQAQLAGEQVSEFYDKQIAALPSSYLLNTPTAQIVDELRRLQKLRHGEVTVWHRHLPDTGTIEYTVGTYEDVTPGVFHKLTGGLTSAGLQILSADINTLADGLILDRFRVQDPDFVGEPPAARMEEVDERLRQALISSQPPSFRRLWGSRNKTAKAALQQLPLQVRVDNSTSENFTVIDIFASDQMGLLYTIARALFDLELSVSLAKIGTYLDQVVDVFYVTDRAGKKLQSEDRLEGIRHHLIEAIGKLETNL